MSELACPDKSRGDFFDFNEVSYWPLVIGGGMGLESPDLESLVSRKDNANCQASSLERTMRNEGPNVSCPSGDDI
jgi:hypothetical protein